MATTLALACLAPVCWLAWTNYDAIVRPLPTQRFVALMALPSAPDDPNLPLVRSASTRSAVRSRAVRGRGRTSWVISSTDVPGGGTLKAPTDAVRALGANLVLTIAMRSAGDDALLDLSVLDAADGRVIQRDRFRSVAPSSAAFRRRHRRPQPRSSTSASLRLDGKIGTSSRRYLLPPINSSRWLRIRRASLMTAASTRPSRPIRRR